MELPWALARSSMQSSKRIDPSSASAVDPERVDFPAGRDNLCSPFGSCGYASLGDHVSEPQAGGTGLAH